MKYIIVKDFKGSENGIDVKEYRKNDVVEIRNKHFAELIEENQLVKRYTDTKLKSVKKNKEVAK